MKKIGLVGGTGPESTLMYYKELNSGIDLQTNGAHMPEIAIESVDFRKAWRMVTEGDYGQLSEYLASKIINLNNSGAQIITLTAATMHIVFDSLEKMTGIKLVSIPEVVAKEAVKRGYKKVGLIGTVFTMEQDYMKKDLRDEGVEVYIPDEKDRELIGKYILEELEVGIVNESTRGTFNEIIEKMKKVYGIEAVILGCTELPLLLNDGNCVVPCLDSVEIHIKKLIELANC